MAKISPSGMPVPRGPELLTTVRCAAFRSPRFGSQSPSGLRDVRTVYPRMSTGPRPATRPTTSWQSAFDMYFGTG